MLLIVPALNWILRSLQLGEHFSPGATLVSRIAAHLWRKWLIELSLMSKTSPGSSRRSRASPWRLRCVRPA